MTAMPTVYAGMPCYRTDLRRLRRGCDILDSSDAIAFARRPIKSPLPLGVGRGEGFAFASRPRHPHPSPLQDGDGRSTCGGGTPLASRLGSQLPVVGRPLSIHGKEHDSHDRKHYSLGRSRPLRRAGPGVAHRFSDGRRGQHRRSDRVRQDHADQRHGAVRRRQHADRPARLDQRRASARRIPQQPGRQSHRPDYAAHELPLRSAGPGVPRRRTRESAAPSLRGSPTWSSGRSRSPTT